MSKKHRKEQKEDKSPVVPQRDKIQQPLNIRDLNWTENQKNSFKFYKINLLRWYSVKVQQEQLKVY